MQLELSAAAISSLQEQLEYSEAQVRCGRSLRGRVLEEQCIAVGGSGAVAARKLCVHVVRCMQRTAAVMAERSTMRTLAVSTAALPRGGRCVASLCTYSTVPAGSDVRSLIDSLTHNQSAVFPRARRRAQAALVQIGAGHATPSQ